MSCCGGCESKRESACGCAGSDPAAEPRALTFDEAFLIGGVSIPLALGVPHKVAWRLAVLQGEQNASEAFELIGDCTAVRVGIVTLSIAAGSLTLQIEGSPEKSNWELITDVPVTTLGYSSLRARGITYRFVRLRYVGDAALGFRCTLATTLAGWRF